MNEKQTWRVETVSNPAAVRRMVSVTSSEGFPIKNDFGTLESIVGVRRW